MLMKFLKIEVINKWKNLKEKRETQDGILTSYEFLQELDSHLPGNSIIIPDEGGNLVWTMQSIKIKGEQKLSRLIFLGLVATISV